MANLMMFFIYKMFGWKIILTNGGNFYRLFVGKKRKILSTFYKNNTVFPLFTHPKCLIFLRLWESQSNALKQNAFDLKIMGFFCSIKLGYCAASEHCSAELKCCL